MNSIDLYLGVFLIIAGFGLSLLNLKRLISGSTKFAAVLVSENLLLTCVGIAFIIRSLQDMGPFNTNMQDFEKRTASMKMNQHMECNFLNVLKSYGPFVVSLVNSFLSLIIDNYMHYKMLNNLKKEDEENAVRNLRSFRNVNNNVASIFKFGKKNFSYIAIGLQWIVPLLVALSMYPVDIKEKYLSRQFQSETESCMAMLDFSNETCSQTNNLTYELRNFIPNYLEAYETSFNNSVELDSVINNVNNIVKNLKNATYSDLRREPKTGDSCRKICYMDNKSLLLYMFGISVTSYFVPITISAVILTKIQVMEVKRPQVKTYVSRELLYNVLFWTPAMFDTFLSLILCSFTSNGMRTSIFNVVANVYQAVKNFMNTKYFKDNSVSPDNIDT